MELEKKRKDQEGLLRINSIENIREEYDTHKSELDELYDHITVGIILRSKSIRNSTLDMVRKLRQSVWIT